MKFKKKVIIVIVVFFWLLCFFYLKKEFSNKIPVANKNSVSVNEYQLMWPGILPDNKLYKVKLIRDKVMSYFIFSPTKKIEYKLLLADKTIYASKLLLDKGDIYDGQITAAKGENYMSQLVYDYIAVSKSNERIPSDLTHRIQLASLKHQQLLDEMIKKVNPQDRKILVDVKYFSKTNYETIVALNNKKIN